MVACRDHTTNLHAAVHTHVMGMQALSDHWPGASAREKNVMVHEESSLHSTNLPTTYCNDDLTNAALAYSTQRFALCTCM